MAVPSSSEMLHDRVVQFIAKTRFPFPDQQDWPADYRTTTNVPTVTTPVKYSDSVTLTPDIVIVDGAGRVREIGEVELDLKPATLPRLVMASLSAPEVPGRGVRHFFVYVPDEIAADAARILRDNQVSYAGLRSFAVEGDDIRIVPIETPGHAKDHR